MACRARGGVFHVSWPTANRWALRWTPLACRTGPPVVTARRIRFGPTSCGRSCTWRGRSASVRSHRREAAAARPNRPCRARALQAAPPPARRRAHRRTDPTPRARPPGIADPPQRCSTRTHDLNHRPLALRPGVLPVEGLCDHEPRSGARRSRRDVGTPHRVARPRWGSSRLRPRRR